MQTGLAGKKGVPRKDHKFEERLEDVRRRIRCQQRLLASLEQKHKAVFPAAIHDADPGGELRLRCYGPTDDYSSKQVVRFRQVVVDYVTDLAARMAANAANNNALTDAQVKTAAVNAIKNDIDGGVVSAALGLLLTIP